VSYYNSGFPSESETKAHDFKPEFRTSLWAVPVAALLIPSLLAIGWIGPWIIFNTLATGHALVKQDWLLGLHSSTYIGGPAFWVIPALSFILALLVAINRKTDEGYSNDGYGRSRTIAPSTPTPPNLSRLNTFQIILALTCALFSIGLFIYHITTTAKSSAQYYDTSATIYTPSLKHPPVSLDAVIKDAHPSKTCALVGTSDVPNCIKVATLPSFIHPPSATTLLADFAAVTLPRGAAQLPSSLMLESTPTPTYSVIIDGSGTRVHAQGIEQLRNAKLSACTFAGPNKLDSAISGHDINSFDNQVADHNLSLVFNNKDIWGYCDRTRPVLIVPVSKQVTYHSAVVVAPAGVLVVTGSPSGAPKVHYEPHPKNIPGPVYPRSIANTQRTSLNWSAGRANNADQAFGYEPLATVKGTPSANYLEESTTNHHLYWVTPLTTDRYDPQSIIAYTVVRADKVTTGHLNPISLYVRTKATKPLYPTPTTLVTNLNGNIEIRTFLPKTDGCGRSPKELSHAKLTYCINLLTKYLH
jgi:hypothetical protein